MPDLSLSAEEILSFSQMNYWEIAFEIGKRFLRGQIEEDELAALVKDAIIMKSRLNKYMIVNMS